MSNTLKNFAVLRSNHDWGKYKAQLTRELLGDSEILNEDLIQFPKPPNSYPCLVAALVTGEGSKTATKYNLSCCYVYEKDASRLLDICDELKQPMDEEVDDIYEDTEYVEDEDIYDLQSDVADMMQSLNVNCSLISAMALELAEIGALKLDKLEERAGKIHHEKTVEPCFNVIEYIMSNVKSK